MTCKDNRDGSCSVEYTPTESGEYDVSVQFAEKHIPGSPFKVVGLCYFGGGGVLARVGRERYSLSISPVNSLSDDFISLNFPDFTLKFIDGSISSSFAGFSCFISNLNLSFCDKLSHILHHLQPNPTHSIPLHPLLYCSLNI